jgi:hypothetical protein
MGKRALVWLKTAYIFGAIVDGAAVIPMAIPWSAGVFWGFGDFTGIYYFAMGMGASLMLGWTLLLIWAYQKPAERRGVLLLTVVVVLGIMSTQITMISLGYVPAGRFIVSFVLQVIGLVLFTGGYIISGRALGRA